MGRKFLSRNEIFAALLFFFIGVGNRLQQVFLTKPKRNINCYLEYALPSNGKNGDIEVDFEARTISVRILKWEGVGVRHGK